MLQNSNKMKPSVPIPINIPTNYKKWLLINHGVADSAKIIAKEEKIASKVGKGELPPVLKLWIASQECFVLGKNYAKKLEKQGRMDKVRREGIPIVLRSSGGEAILHNFTCLNLGVITPRQFYPDAFIIGKAFTLFSSGIVQFFEKMKIPISFGKTKTFCPGPYDLLVGERKIAGISLLLRGNFSLVHGTLFINSKKNYGEKLKVFYPSLDDEFTSLRTLMGKRINMEEVISAIIQSYKISLNITFEDNKLS